MSDPKENAAPQQNENEKDVNHQGQQTEKKKEVKGLSMFDDTWFENLSPAHLFRKKQEDVTKEPAFTANIDIVETDDAFLIDLDCPGIEKKDISIEVVDGALQIQGKRSRVKIEETSQMRREEREFGSFCRTFRIPKIADADKIEASHENGVLAIRLPKKPDLNARVKKIEIN